MGLKHILRGLQRFVDPYRFWDTMTDIVEGDNPHISDKLVSGTKTFLLNLPDYIRIADFFT